MKNINIITDSLDPDFIKLRKLVEAQRNSNKIRQLLNKSPIVSLDYFSKPQDEVLSDYKTHYKIQREQYNVMEGLAELIENLAKNKHRTVRINFVQFPEQTYVLFTDESYHELIGGLDGWKNDAY